MHVSTAYNNLSVSGIDKDDEVHTPTLLDL